MAGSPLRAPLPRGSCRHHLLHAFSILPTGPAISSGCKQEEKPYLAFTTWNGSSFPAGLSCCAEPSSAAAVLLLALLCSCSHGGAWIPSKCQASQKKKNSMKAWLPSKPWNGSLLLAAKVRATCCDAGQAALPLLPSSPIPLLPLLPSTPSGMLWLLLAWSRDSLNAHHKQASSSMWPCSSTASSIIFPAWKTAWGL